jgi:serpin B
LPQKIAFPILIVISTLSLNAQHSDQHSELTVSLNNFSFDIYRQIKSDKENLFFSPLSIDLALLMAYEGAMSETKSEFEKVLYLDKNIKYNDVSDFISDIKKWNDSSNYTNISNAIWIQNKFKIEKDYQNTIKNKYSSDIFTIDFSNSDKSALKINNWVSEKTNNLIKEIISPNDIDNLTRLVITNAIYFLGKWEEKFDKDLTKQDNFYSINTSIAKVDFMNKTEFLGYYENKDFQFITKPYIGNDKSFCVILPSSRFGITNVDTKLGKSFIDTIFQSIKFVEVNLSLPKFKLETSFSLNEPLKKLGLLIAFSPKADFAGITTEKQLMISNIKHKAYIEVNEEKTEAAAANLVVMRPVSAGELKPAPKIFKADHPFIFMILDNKTKRILFMGRYVKL